MISFTLLYLSHLSHPSIYLVCLRSTTPLWFTDTEYSITCSISLEDLTGGRIKTILHMSNLQMKHDIFEWENYGVEWGIDHIIPFELMDRYSVLARYTLNNYVNLTPKTSEHNKKERYAKLNAARTKPDESQSY